MFHCLSEGWKPLLAKEVAATANLSSSHASAQLKQLLERGYTREIRLPGAKRTRYEVSDRFYNLYYLLRFSRAGRDRLERLVEFLHYLFGPTGYTQRADTLAPAHYSVLHALSDDLARRGNWTAALSRLEQALRVGSGQSVNMKGYGWHSR